MARRKWVVPGIAAKRRYLTVVRDARRKARAEIPPRSEWTYRAGDPRPRYRNGLLIAGLLPETPWKKLKARVMADKGQPRDKPKWTLRRNRVGRSARTGRFISRRVAR